jgi:O-antigen/teichoic acid export membrane protein
MALTRIWHRVSHGLAMPRLLRESSMYFAGNVVSRALSLVMIPFYAAHLSTAEYGILSLVELSTTVIAIVFGLQSVGQTLTRVYHEQGDAAGRRLAASTALLGALAGAVIIAGAAVAAAPGIARAINLADHIPLVRASFVAMALTTVSEFVLVYYRMMARARFYLAYALITLFATLALNILFIGVLNCGVWGFVSSRIIVAGSGTVLLFWRMAREVGLGFSPRLASAMARFGGPLVASSTAYYAIHFSDRLFLAHVSRSDVGVYTMAYNFAFLLSVLVGDSFSKSFDVSFYAYAEKEGWQQRFVRIGFWLVLVLGGGAFGISLFGRDALRLLLPAAYVPPVLMLPVLVFGYFFREIGDFFRNILLIGRGSGLVGRIAIGSAVLNIVLNGVLITWMGLGIWGASAATALTWVVYWLVCWMFAWRAQAVPFRVSPLVRLLAASAVFLGLHEVWVMPGIYAQIALDCVWISAFLGCVAVFYLGAGERREVLGAARRLLVHLA